MAPISFVPSSMTLRWHCVSFTLYFHTRKFCLNYPTFSIGYLPVRHPTILYIGVIERRGRGIKGGGGKVKGRRADCRLKDEGDIWKYPFFSDAFQQPQTSTTTKKGPGGFTDTFEPSGAPLEVGILTSG